MNKRDLLQIQTLFFESFAQIWESNLGPAFDDVDKRLSRIESNYVTKDYLDDKIGILKSENNTRFIKGQNQTKRLVEILHDKQVLSGTELKEINSI